MPLIPLPMRRRAALAIAALVLAAGQGSAAVEVPYRHEFTEGDPNAKVTVIEYASLTCPHCGQFHREVYPAIKKAYVDTGKVRFVFRHYPLDSLAMAGAILTVCAQKSSGRKLVDALFKNQDAWVLAPRPIEPLKSYAQLAGMTATDVEGCLRDKKLFEEMRDDQRQASELHEVEMTPAFFVGDEDIQGGPDYAAFAEILDRHIAAAAKPAK